MATDAPDTEADRQTAQGHHSWGRQGLPFERERMPSMARIRRNLGS